MPELPYRTTPSNLRMGVFAIALWSVDGTVLESRRSDPREVFGNIVLEEGGLRSSSDLWLFWELR